MQFSPRQKVTLQAIPDGPAGIRQTLNIMRQFVKAGKLNYRFRQLALSLVKRNGQKDWFGEIRDLQHFVRDNIRYIKDIRGVETVATPDITLDMGQGDCDDKSVLLATLLESIGHPTRFVAVSFRPGQFAHVFVETKVGQQWIPLETTEPVEPGWYPKGVINRMVVHI
jgi:transglutaminase-like putative cysteine protease